MTGEPSAGGPRSRALGALVSAGVYLQATSIVNAVRQRFMRLRQPKYLFGAIAGVAYMYFFFLRRVIHTDAHGARIPLRVLDPATIAQLAAFAAVFLCVVVIGGWLFPSGRAALRFSEADIAFLFPAPVTRTMLIQFALLRSQVGIFFSAFLMSLFLGRGNAFGGNAVLHAAGMWIILATLNLHFLGSSFVRERLLDLGVRPLLRRVLVGGALLLVAGACAWSMQGRITVPAPGQIADAAAAQRWLASLLDIAPLSWLLAPFRWVVAPFFATDIAGFLRVLGPALLLLVAHYIWVVRSQVSFEEASMDLARRRAERVAAMQQGKQALRTAPTRARRPPFRLAGTGFVPIAFLWKGLIAMGPFWRLRTWVIGCAIVIVGSRLLAASPGGRIALMVVGMSAGVMSSWLLLLGPMILQRGMREMLENLDILRAGPLRGWQIALGELLSPVVVMTFAMWFALVVVASALWGQPNAASVAPGGLGAAAIGITLVAPPLCGLMLCMPFAGLLYFPAWTAAPGSGGRGIEVMGQRLIFMAGYLVTLIIALLPAVAAGSLLFWLVRMAASAPAALVAAAVAAAAILIVELVFAVDLLGRRIDRFDVSQELAR